MKYPKTTLAVALLGHTCLSLGVARAEINVGIEIGSPPPSHPPVVVEQRPAPPGYDAVWVEPHYAWRHDHWGWENGYYAHRPHPGAYWEPGHYDYRHGHHFWMEGGWR